MHRQGSDEFLKMFENVNVTTIKVNDDKIFSHKLQEGYPSAYSAVMPPDPGSWRAPVSGLKLLAVWRLRTGRYWVGKAAKIL